MITDLLFHLTAASQPEGVTTIFGGHGNPSTGFLTRFKVSKDEVYCSFLKKNEIGVLLHLV